MVFPPPESGSFKEFVQVAFSFEATDIPEVILVEGPRYPDDRGFFCELFREEAFRAGGVVGPFVQDNFARSREGVLRGLHYQNEPYPQGKLVRALRGKIFDVAVDIRPRSATLGKWVGAVLSEENGRFLWVPPGFAHGYCVLAGPADVFYKVTAPFKPELDRGIQWDDPTIGVEWPMKNPQLSEKDLRLPTFREVEAGGWA